MLQERHQRLGVLRVVEHDAAHVGVALEAHVERTGQVLVGEEQAEERLVAVSLSLVGEAVVGDIVGKLHIGHIVEVQPEVGVHIVDVDMEISPFLGSVVETEMLSNLAVEVHQRDSACEVTVAGVGVDDDWHDGVDVPAQFDSGGKQHGERTHHSCSRSSDAKDIKFAHDGCMISRVMVFSPSPCSMLERNVSRPAAERLEDERGEEEE